MASNSSGRERPKKTPCFLSRIPQEELKTLCVAIKRPNLKATLPALPIQRDLLNPADLLIHYREDEGTRPIFDREDIVCNTEDLEERLVLNNNENSRSVNRHFRTSRSPSSDSEENVRRERRNSRSHSPARRKNNERYRSKSPRHQERNYRSESRSPQRRSEYRIKERNQNYKRNRSRSRSKSRNKYRLKSPPIDSRKDRSRSRSPNSNYYKRQSRSRDSSPPLRSSEYRHKRSDRRSKSREYSPLKPGEYNPKKAEKIKSRDRYKEERHRYGSRSKSPRPSTSRNSSDYKERRRSQSPRYRRSPDYYERKGSDKYRSSRSPHPPIVTFERHSNRRSRSPKHHGKDYRRSRSRSPRKHRWEGIPPQAHMFPEYYFENSEFWGPLVPGFRPAMYPTGPFPRGQFLFPRMPAVMPYHPFRQRLPVYNVKVRPNISKPTATITSVEAANVEEKEQISERAEVEDKTEGKEDSASVKEINKEDDN